jgi:hypothetical protein
MTQEQESAILRIWENLEEIYGQVHKLPDAHTHKGDFAELTVECLDLLNENFKEL